MSISYVISRLGTFILVVFIAITINFLIPRLAPGDPVTQKLESMASQGISLGGDFNQLVEVYKEKFGYDKPLWQQYLNYLSDLLRADFGYSIREYPTRTSTLILQALPWTIGLLGVSTVLAFSLGTILGALLAWPATPKVVSRFFIPLFVVFSSIPYYLLGLLLLFFFSLTWPIFPGGGSHDIFVQPGFSVEYILDIIEHATLPALSIIVASLAFWGLGMRGMMISVQGEDFMTLAEAKGLGPSRLFFSYGMRNAFLPQATGLALAMGNIVSGAVLVEVIFRYPGIGYTLFQAILGKDFFVMQGILLLLIISIAFAMMVMDFTYPFLDPRVRYGKQQ